MFSLSLSLKCTSVFLLLSLSGDVEKSTEIVQTYVFSSSKVGVGVGVVDASAEERARRRRSKSKTPAL